MNFEQMSDFEINQQVGNVSGLATASEPVFKQVIRNSNGKEFDPCNSWADAGPIIQEHGIGLMPFKNLDAAAWDVSSGILSAKKINHENPLRAAMIVFLMMQGSKCSN